MYNDECLCKSDRNVCIIFWVTVLIRVDRLQTSLLLPLHLSLCLYCQALSFFLPLVISSPYLFSTIDANYTICPPSVSWDRTMSVFSLLTFTHYWIQTCVHVLLFERCATMPLTVLQTGSLSRLLSSLKIALSLSTHICAQLQLMILLLEQRCRYTCALVCLHIHICVVLSLMWKSSTRDLNLFWWFCQTKLKKQWLYESK